MGIFLISPETLPELEAVLSPEAAGRVAEEGIYTLGDFDSAFQCTGCIQFTTLKEGDERVGRLLYLYVRPAFRRDGIAADLLTEMEETLYYNGIKTVRFLLPEDSILAGYLESYGFDTVLAEDKAFLNLSDYSVENRKFKAHMKLCKPLSAFSKPEAAKYLKKAGAEWKDPLVRFSPEFSAVMPFKDEGFVLLMAGETLFQPTISFIRIIGDHPERTITGPASFALVKIKEKYTHGDTLLLSDHRIIQWFEKYLEDVLTVIPAVAGELMTEPSGMENTPDAEEDGEEWEPLEDSDE